MTSPRRSRDTIGLARPARRAGVVGIAIGAMIVGPALQAGAQPVKPVAPAGAIVVPANSEVTTTVLGKNAGDSLGYGLRKPKRIVVCTDCQTGNSLDLGAYEDGQILVFYLTDNTHGETFLSTDPQHAQLFRTTKYTWVINWDDAGGDGDYNDLTTYIKLTPSG